jgi:hypothetical protein
MQERLAPLIGRAVEVAALMVGEEAAQPGLGFRGVLRGDLQQQMMLVAFADIGIALGFF